jgi:ring-1,2-phenylacetyl-CoA epoxidase subunit PaaB
MQDSNQGILWEVFIQASPGIPHKHAGSLHAQDAEMALLSARDVYTRRSEGMNIWVVPANSITASLPFFAFNFILLLLLFNPSILILSFANLY